MDLIYHFHDKLNARLNKLDAPVVKADVVEIETSFFQVKLPILQGC